MKAVAYTRSLPIEDPLSLQDLALPDLPTPTGRDLLVEVGAVSVNPVDYKVRLRADPGGAPKLLGWDAAGVVRAVGPEARLFRPGDEVFYAGDIGRPGTNAELHLVDERIVGPKANRLSFAEAAAVPLTAITAWEALFDRLRIPRDGGDGADHLRCRRRRLHRGAACAAAHRPAPRRHGEPAGGGRLGPQHGGT